jgi:hypothetical protein
VSPEITGSYADWTTAAIALAALIFAATSTIISNRTNRAQRRTLELQQMQFEALQFDRIRAQATKITVQYSRNDEQATIRNDSDAPVLNVQLRNPASGYAPRQPGRRYDVGLLIPRQVETVSWGPEHGMPFLYFEDSASRQWIRDPTGELKEFIE